MLLHARDECHNARSVHTNAAWQDRLMETDVQTDGQVGRPVD